jgi:glycosyltransferase involved in cell wall biosynthesis
LWGKGILEAAKAFEKLRLKLKIVGEVVDVKLASQARLAARQVESLGRVEDVELGELYASARGFVALSRDEDFGMTVVEAMSYGTPVLAYNGGGYKETVISGENGILIDGTDIESVRVGIERMEKTKWDKKRIKKWASRFGRGRFEKEIRKVVENIVT